MVKISQRVKFCVALQSGHELVKYLYANNAFPFHILHQGNETVSRVNHLKEKNEKDETSAHKTWELNLKVSFLAKKWQNLVF